MRRNRPIIQWKDETKNVKRRRRVPTMTFSPADELVPGAMFVSAHVLEPQQQWDIPTLVPRKKHRRKEMTVLIYAGPIRLVERRHDGRTVNHIKHTFIMGGGRYIVDALEYLTPARDK